MTLNLFQNSAPSGSMDSINERIRSCVRCDHRKDLLVGSVPGWGATETVKLLVLGQHPGKGERKILTAGPGRHMRDQFYKLGLGDDQIYWANACCCGPPADEDLEPWQLSNCAPYVEETIDALLPKLIVGLGNSVRKRLFMPKHMESQRKANMSLTDTRFRVWDYRGFSFVMLINPAGALRNIGLARELFEEDVEKDFAFLKKVLEERRLV